MKYIPSLLRGLSVTILASILLPHVATSPSAARRIAFISSSARLMKRFIALYIIICLAIFSSTALAESEMRDVAFEKDLALRLNLLNLFDGVGNNPDGTPNFDLARTPTRIESLVMLIRVLGKRTEAERCLKTHPFIDVPSWADGYVSYAYDKGLTRGADTLFQSGRTLEAVCSLKADAYRNSGAFQFHKLINAAYMVYFLHKYLYSLPQIFSYRVHQSIL